MNFLNPKSWSNHEKEVTGKPVASMNSEITGNSRAGSSFDVNTTLRGIFMNVTLQAAVHLGRDNMEILRFTKNQLLKSVKQLFQVPERLIKDQTEISGLTTIDYEQPTWRSTVLLCDKAIEITNAKPTSFPTP